MAGTEVPPAGAGLDGGTTTISLRHARAEVIRRVLDLNRAHEAELSPLNGEELPRLIDSSFLARATESGDAFLIAFDQDAAYRSPNFIWFQERYPAFVYVDRLAVAEHARGRGHARRLYGELFDAARNAGQVMVGCEVNVRPPNAPSDALHAALGFKAVGKSRLTPEKTVRYLALTL